MAIDRSDEFLSRLADNDPALMERVIGGVLVAVSPTAGLPRVVAAAPHVATALSS